MTGILDRLERDGWVARERDPADRRAVLVRVLKERNAELMRLYSGMNTSMHQICDAYADPDLELLAEFLRRAALLTSWASRSCRSGFRASGGDSPS